MTQLLEFLLKHLWTVVMPGGALSECPGRAISTTFIGRPEQQLNFLQIGRHVNRERFEGEYKKFRTFFAAFAFSQLPLEALDTHGSYFKFNLAAINLYNLFVLRRLGPVLCDITAMLMASCAMPCVTTGMRIST